MTMTPAEVVNTVHKALLDKAVKGELAMAIATEFGVLLEPLIENKVRDAVRRMEVSFK